MVRLLKLKYVPILVNPRIKFNILHPSRDIWTFLMGVKKNGVPLDRANLILECTKEFALLNFICEMVCLIDLLWLKTHFLSSGANRSAYAQRVFHSNVVLSCRGGRNYQSIQIHFGWIFASHSSASVCWIKSGRQSQLSGTCLFKYNPFSTSFSSLY